MHTYAELMKNVLVRMGESNLLESDGTVNSSALSLYEKTVPTLLNEALILLRTAGKYARKTLEIPAGTEEADLSLLAEDFFSLGEVYLLEEDGRRKKTGDYTLLEGHLFSPRQTDRAHLLSYCAYPAPITNPEEDTPIDVEDEVFLLLPIYIEGRLRMALEEDYATTVLSEFEQRRGELILKQTGKAAVFREGTVPW